MELKAAADLTSTDPTSEERGFCPTANQRREADNVDTYYVQLQFLWCPLDAAVIKLELNWSECEELQFLSQTLKSWTLNGSWV